jgi:hypothetical protein
MTNVGADSLRVLPTQEPCDCLPGTLWQVFLGAAAWIFFAISLAWLIQAAGVAIPAPPWWKSMLSLGCVLAFTYGWRVARRLDAHAKQGWSVSDAAMVLASVFITGVFVMRGTALVGAGLIVNLIAMEGLSLWRLKLLPMQTINYLGHRIRRRRASAASTDEVIPIRTLAVDELAANVLTSHREDDTAVSQQFTRRETESGVEISGFVRGRIEAAELLTSIDIAFCPTLASEPTLDFETICDEDLEVHIATLRTYGARLDLKRRGDAHDPLEFTLEIHVASETIAEADAMAIREPADS